MKSRYIITTISIIFFATILQGQESTQDFYKVEWEKFTPPTKESIRTFEGFPAENFLAPNLKGEELFLGDFKGKKVLLWFWSIEDQKSEDILPMINDLAKVHADELSVVTFATETSTVLKEDPRTSNANFHIIPNGKVFGEMAYGADLGVGRIFLIDEFGIIQKVIPREGVNDIWTVKNMIKNILGLK